MRARPARRRREHHLHDLRRRLRDARRAGGDQARQAGSLDLHRHRPDGPEALRDARQARVQLRKRRAGRGLGHGAVRMEQGLEDRRARNEHAARLLQERRHGVREALQAARRQDRRQGELRDRPEQRRDRGQPAELAQGGGVRDLDGLQRASRVRLGAQGVAQHHADPQLLGRRRHLLGDEQPEGDQVLRRHVRVRVRRRPEQGRSEGSSRR